MLFVHESGHIWAMKRCGMHTKGIYFIPFLGAAAVTDEEFKTRNDESFIAIMGPIWGLALSCVAAITYLISENPFFAAVASWMAMINLFNLIPINPLDGGRIVKSIAFSLHSHLGLIVMFAGFVAAGFFAYEMKIGLFYFLLVVGGTELFVEMFLNRRPGKRLYQKTLVYFLEQEKSGEDFKIAERGLVGEDVEKIREQSMKRAIQQTEASMAVFTLSYEIKQKLRMSRGELFVSICLFLLVSGSLFGIMIYMNHVPGAAAAMDILKD